MEDKQKDRKKSAWSYSLVTHIMEVLFPTGEKRHYNLSKQIVGMTATQELGFYYGIKQWFASNGAAFKDAAAKITSYEADYNGLIEHGLELAGEGKIRIIGSGSQKSVEVAEAKRLKSELTAHVDIEMILAMKKLNISLTADQAKILAEHEAAQAEAKSAKVKK